MSDCTIYLKDVGLFNVFCLVVLLLRVCYVFQLTCTHQYLCGENSPAKGPTVPIKMTLGEHWTSMGSIIIKVVYTVKSLYIRCTSVGNNWQLNCWSLRCSWSIACRRCSNYIFILHLTLRFNILGKDNCKPRLETFVFWDLVWFILEILRYISLSGRLVYISIFPCQHTQSDHFLSCGCSRWRTTPCWSTPSIANPAFLRGPPSESSHHRCQQRPHLP